MLYLNMIWPLSPKIDSSCFDKSKLFMPPTPTKGEHIRKMREDNESKCSAKEP